MTCLSISVGVAANDKPVYDQRTKNLGSYHVIGLVGKNQGRLDEYAVSLVQLESDQGTTTTKLRYLGKNTGRCDIGDDRRGYQQCQGMGLTYPGDEDFLQVEQKPYEHSAFFYRADGLPRYEPEDKQANYRVIGELGVMHVNLHGIDGLYFADVVQFERHGGDYESTLIRYRSGVECIIINYFGWTAHIYQCNEYRPIIANQFDESGNEFVVSQLGDQQEDFFGTPFAIDTIVRTGDEVQGQRRRTATECHTKFNDKISVCETLLK